MLLAEQEVRHPSNEISIFITPNTKGIFQSLRFVQEGWKKLCICRCPLTSLSDGRYSPTGLWSTESIQCSWGRVFTRRSLFHKLQVKGWKPSSQRDICHWKSRICLLCLVCFFVLLLFNFFLPHSMCTGFCFIVVVIIFAIVCLLYITPLDTFLLDKVNDGKFDFYESNNLICLLIK